VRLYFAILFPLLALLHSGAAEPPDYTEDHALGGGVTELGRSLADIRNALEPWQKPRPGAVETARELIPRLDAPDFKARDQAMAELLALMRESESAIRHVVNPDGDHPPETRNRLRWLRQADLNDPVMPLRGLLEWIRIQKLSALLPELAAIRAEHFDPGLEQQFIDLVGELSNPQQRVTLLAWSKHERPLLRRAAAQALHKIEDLTPLLDDSDESAALAAAIRLGQQGDASGADTLKQLRKSANPSIAGRATWAADTAVHDPKLDLPHSIVSAADPGRGERGLVVAGGNRPEVHRLAADGKRVAEWAFDVMFIGDVIPLKDGGFLLAVRENRGTYALLGINEKGKVVWREQQPDYPCPNLLSNGHILVASDDEVRELDNQRKVIWRYDLQRHGRGRMAWRTVTGTTLIGLSRSVIEVDEAKNLVWEMAFPDDYVVSCQGLPSGNRLLILKYSNRVIEVTPAKKIVWEWDAPEGVTLWDSFRLPNGNLLAKTENGALELSYGKRLLWKMDFGDAGHIRRL